MTVVVPTEKASPGICDFAQTKFPWAVQLSEAVGSTQVITASHESASLSWVIVVGQLLITGFWVSTTITSNEQVILALLASSVAV